MADYIYKGHFLWSFIKLYSMDRQPANYGRHWWLTYKPSIYLKITDHPKLYFTGIIRRSNGKTLIGHIALIFAFGIMIVVGNYAL